MSDRRCRIGFVGLKGINAWHYLPGIMQSEKAVLVAGADPSSGARDAFREKSDVPLYETLPEMAKAENLDAVMIGTPNPVHLLNVREAAEAGLHMSVTKPLCNTVAQCEDAIAICRDRGLVLQTGHEYRFRPSVRRGLEMVNAGGIGHVTMLTAHMGSLGGMGKLTAAGTWRNKAENVPGGCLNLLGVHMLDIGNCILGRPVAVNASIQKLLTKAELADTVAVTVEYQEGRVGVITSSYASAPSDMIHVFGTEANLLITDSKLFQERERELTEITDLPLEGSAQAIIDQLCDAITEKTPLDTPGEAGLLTVAQNEAAVRSASEAGRRVALTELLLAKG